MKRALAILLLLATLLGWLQTVCRAEESPCCCGAACACKAAPCCPCDCAGEKKQLNSMPLTVVEWPQAVVAPQRHTPQPMVICCGMPGMEHHTKHPALLARRHAPPGLPPPGAVVPRAPYTGFRTPLLA